MSVHTVDLGRRWTWDDLAELPDVLGKCEIVDGVLVVTPPATSHHQWRGAGLLDQLRAAAPTGWMLVQEMAIRLADDLVRVPDAVVHRWPVQELTIPAVGLVIEVVSRSSRSTDRFAKPGEYAQAGIPIYWRLETDPVHRLHTFVLGDGVYVPGPVIDTRGTAPAPWGDVEIDLTVLLPGA